MAKSTQNSTFESILHLIKQNNFTLNIDYNPNVEKIERIKESILRKQKLFEKQLAKSI